MPSVAGVVIATGGAYTGRRTFGEVIDELSRPINGDDTTIRAMAQDAFRSAVRTMNRKGDWPWEYQEENITMTASSRTSVATGAIKKPLSMHYIDSSGFPYQRLAFMPIDRMREKFSQNYFGMPFNYTIPNLFEAGTVEWFPIPGVAYTTRFTYYRVTPVPRLEQEALEIPETALEPYMAYAWYEFLKRMPSQQQPFPIAVAAADAQKAFREISAHVTTPGDRSRVVDAIHG